MRIRNLQLTLVLLFLAAASIGCAESATSPSASDPATAGPPPVVDEHRVTDDGEALIGPGGKRIPIDPKKAIGYIDAAVPNGKSVDLNGWAGTGNLSGPADVVVATAGKRSVAITPSVNRSDVATGYDQPRLERSGFNFSVPVSVLDCTAPRQGLEIYAVANGAAAPLTWLGDVPRRIADAC